MPQETVIANESLIPSKPIPDGARDFTERVRGLLDGQPKDEATVAQALEGMDEMFDLIAAGLYNLASMLVGEGEDSIRLVETAVTNTEVSAGHDPREGRARTAGVRWLMRRWRFWRSGTLIAWQRRRVCSRPRQPASRTTIWTRRVFPVRSWNR